MEEYYKKWAPEYEKFYYTCEPEIKKALQFTSKLIQQLFKNKSVLEIASGTGYWTRILSTSAKEIVATDILKEVIKLAQEKKFACPVSFVITDAYNLPTFDKSFNGGLANFWFSHIPKNQIDSFLNGFHNALEPNSQVFLCDNNPQHLPDGPLITLPDDENTYRLRQTTDGSEHQVLKNYYSVTDLVSIFSKHVKNFDETNVYYDEYLWRVAYKL